METPTTSTDRQAQARAEAERRIGGGMGVALNIAARQGFVVGAEWADANPQPTTITRRQIDEVWADGPWDISGRSDLDDIAEALGIEVVDDDE